NDLAQEAVRPTVTLSLKHGEQFGVALIPFSGIKQCLQKPSRRPFGRWRLQVQTKCHQYFGQRTLEPLHLLMRNSTGMELRSPTNAQFISLSIEQQFSPFWSLTPSMISNAFDLHLSILYTNIIAWCVDSSRAGEYMPIAHTEARTVP